MKVEILFSHKRLAGVFEKGNIVTIKTILEPKDVFIKLYNDKIGKKEKVKVKTKGHYKDYILTSILNGEEYSGLGIVGEIGFEQEKKLFKRIN